MKSSKNVSIIVPPALLQEAERIARREGRTKSELFREALRRYVVQSQFREIQGYGVERARQLGLKESDVEALIHEYRREIRARGRSRQQRNHLTPGSPFTLRVGAQYNFER